MYLIELGEFRQGFRLTNFVAFGLWDGNELNDETKR